MTKIKYSLSLVLLAFISSSAEVDVECPPHQYIKIPLPDCTKYVLCDEGHGTEGRCTSGMYFNPRLEICDFPDNVPECDGGTRPPVTTTPGPTGSTPPVSSTTTPPRTTTPPTSGQLTECGQTAQSVSGYIAYKYREPYEANELCAFIIRAPGSVGIVFTLDNDGFHYKEDPNAINIFTFDENGLRDTHHLGQPNPITEVFMSGSIAVVVFKSHSDKGTGFWLRYNAHRDAPRSNGANLVFSNVSGGDLTLPSWPNYANTTNAIVLSSGDKTVEGNSSLQLAIMDENLAHDPECRDKLIIYSFLKDYLTYEETFCNQLEHKTVFQTKGIFILIFYKWAGSLDASVNINWKINN